jgi:hypothetical protein
MGEAAALFLNAIKNIVSIHLFEGQNLKNRRTML